nr:hypothetical protein Iba_chr04fCG11750 [Ipomoea batatas]
MERKNEDQPASDAITSCAFNGWENQPRGGKEPNSDAVKGSVSPLSSSEAGFQFGGTLPGSGLGFLVVYRKESMARVEALNVKYWGRTVHDDDAAGYLRQSVGHCMLGADDQKAITKEINSARHSISRAAKHHLRSEERMDEPATLKNLKVCIQHNPVKLSFYPPIGPCEEIANARSISQIEGIAALHKIFRKGFIDTPHIPDCNYHLEEEGVGRLRPLPLNNDFARRGIGNVLWTAVPLTGGQKERLKATSTVSFDFRNKSAHGALGDLEDDRPYPFSTTGMLVESNSCGGTGSLEPTLFKI